MGKAATTAKVLGTGAKVAVKYGPQVKIAWDNGGKQAGAAAARRARSVTARRKALKQAATVRDGSILKVAPNGTTTYVVFTGDQPIATYPHSNLPYEVLLAHADLGKRIPAARA
jgi:hypothetical protein